MQRSDHKEQKSDSPQESETVEIISLVPTLPSININTSSTPLPSSTQITTEMKQQVMIELLLAVSKQTRLEHKNTLETLKQTKEQLSQVTLERDQETFKTILISIWNKQVNDQKDVLSQHLATANEQRVEMIKMINDLRVEKKDAIEAKNVAENRARDLLKERTSLLSQRTNSTRRPHNHRNPSSIQFFDTSIANKTFIDITKMTLEERITQLENIFGKKIINEMIPNDYKCSITHDIMTDPVINLQGITYDRKSITNWLINGSKYCPITQQLMTEAELVPNRSVKNIIISFIEKKEAEAKHLLKAHKRKAMQEKEGNPTTPIEHNSDNNADEQNNRGHGHN